jgi:poly(3-hydroxybutyrate) depolymerase
MVMTVLTMVACGLLSACVDQEAGDEALASELANCPASVTSDELASSDVNPMTGLRGPAGACSPQHPCTRASGPITNPINLTRASGAPMCDAGDAMRTWTDVNGELRYACVYKPIGARRSTPRALLVWLPGSESDVSTLYTMTTLRSKATWFDLTSNGVRPGFVLAGVQARNTHSFGNPDGQHFDYWYRDLGAATCNPDVRSIDALIDGLVAEGYVDPRRIFVAGWSNGAFFAQLYAIARHVTPTPGGNRIAAAIAYAGGDPFGTIANTGLGGLATYPQSQVPIYNLHRDCDALVPCDAANAGPLAGLDIETWFAHLRSSTSVPQATWVGDPNAVDVTIDRTGQLVTSCLAPSACGPALGLANHINWPGGLGGQRDWEPESLAFLRDHPRP